MANKQSLIRLRATEKGRLTVFTKWVEAWNPEIGLRALQLRVNKIEECYSKFTEIQSQILALEDDDIQRAEGLNFENNYFAILEQAYNILDNTQSPVPVDKPQLGGKIQVALPKLQLTSFSGDYTDWPAFSELFTALIIDNNTLSDVQKLCYLKSVLKGSAVSVIEGLALTNANFTVAWDLLRDRFCNEHLIINKLLQTLTDQQQLEIESGSKLRSLLDITQRSVQALEALSEPVKNWNSILVHIVASKLDPVTRKAWELHRSHETLPTYLDLMTFLKHRCQVLETMDNEKRNMPKSTSSRKNSKPVTSQQSKTTRYTFVASTHLCSVCQGQHPIFYCEEFIAMSVEQRLQKVKKAKLCFNCLKASHSAKQCLSSSCRKCDRKHNTLLHKEEKVVHTNHNSENTLEVSNTAAVCNIQGDSQRVLLTTAIVRIQSKSHKWIECRCLIDNGSQTNIITSALCEKLNLSKKPVNIPVLSVNNSSNTALSQVAVKIQSRLNGDYIQSINCLVLPSITGPIPAMQLDTRNIKWPKDITLADPTFYSPGQIELLLGAKIFWEIIQSRSIKLNPSRLTLKASKLGWLCTGTLPFKEQAKTNVACLLNQTSNIEQQLQKFWAVEEVFDPKMIPMSEQDAYCELLYTNTVIRNDNGRYLVTLPRNLVSPKLGESNQIARKRIYTLERTLSRRPKLYEEYRAFMHEYEHLGHMSKVEDIEYANSEHYFIPHFAVLREQSESTPLRVVFNASQPTSSGVSLNDTLLPGPTIQSDLLSVLLRFRTYNYVLVGDISKFFRQIEIDRNQRNLQLIYWRDSVYQPMQVYRLNTVTYGMTSSPYLATRTLRQLFMDEGHKFPLATKSQNNCYCDDFLVGDLEVETVINLKKEITSLLNLGGFPIGKWISNNKEVLDSIPTNEKSTAVAYSFNEDSVSRTLGMTWHPKQDQFSYTIQLKERKPTKRNILSDIASIFDPIGLIGPVIAQAKIIMQDLWRQQANWDEQISSDLECRWNHFRDSLESINELRFPRQVQEIHHPVDMQIHVFGDSSLLAYGSCAYMRVTYPTHTSSRLIMSKSRVAPLKQISLPKLELSAALLSVQLAERICLALNKTIDIVHFWTDSTIVLSWLINPSKKEVFVANRVTKILQGSDISQWHHVPSQDNPADVISRGATPNELKKSKLWFEGPSWLIHDVSSWPNLYMEQRIVENIQSSIVTTMQLTHNEIEREDSLLQKFSTMNKLQRVVAYCLRFASNCKLPREQRILGPLTVEELNSAWEKVIWKVQQEAFQKDIVALQNTKEVLPRSDIKQLNPILDNKGLLRVGGRIQNSWLDEETKHPVILPTKHFLTKLIIEHEHRKNLHAGLQLLSCILREKVWILNARRAIRSVLHNCITCFRTRPKLARQQMGILPGERVQQSRVFQNIGVDMGGPIYLKQNSRRNAPVNKAYFVIFVCLAVKAVHIELVPDMSTYAFIHAFKRFIGRRGKCTTIYSDNGTNFVGANRELKELRQLMISQEFQTTVSNKAADEGIKWKFIPPLSPHQGGLHEAAIKQAKYHMKKVIGTEVYTYDQMNTLLVQVEACLNSRPLIPLSDDPKDIQVLTPAHFLVGDTLNTVPEPDLTSIPENRLDKYQYLQRKFQSFWKRWVHEYITGLQVRSKWPDKHSNIQKNRLVLIEDKQLPPMKWKLGRVEEIYPGQDGLVRVVKLRTPQGVIKRTVQHLAPLPLDIEVASNGGRDVESLIQKTESTVRHSELSVNSLHFKNNELALRQQACAKFV